MTKEDVQPLLTKLLGEEFRRMFFEWGKTVSSKDGWVSFDELSTIEEFSRSVTSEEEFLSGSLLCDNIETDSIRKLVKLKSAEGGNLIFIEVTGVPKEAQTDEIKKFFSTHGVVSQVSRSSAIMNRNKAIISIDVNGGKSLLEKQVLSYGETDCPLTNRFLPKIYLKKVANQDFEKKIASDYVKPEKYIKPGLTLKISGEGLQDNVPIATLSHLFGEKYSRINKGVRYASYRDSTTAFVLFRTKDLAEHSMYSFIANPMPARGVQLSVSIASDREQEFIKQQTFEHEQQRIAAKTARDREKGGDKRSKMESKMMECVEAGDFDFA